jgi:murein DD-endopeptidase MepM/ murein hydrolase activator NlpD
MAAIGGPTMAPAPALDKGDPAEAARQLETFFVRQFLALSRPKTQGMLDGGFAGDTFHDMLDGAMADAISDGGGLGLAATFESALGGDQAATAVRPHGLSMTDALDAQRLLGGGGATGAAAGGGVLARPTTGRFSSGFGPRVDPLGAGQGFHAGLDIAAPAGQAVSAAAAGEVIHAGPAGTYGNMIAVRHPDGTETRYAHLSAVGVKVGQHVDAGTPIGAVGSTGHSTGPHLHFEVRQGGKAVDPRPYLQPNQPR